MYIAERPPDHEIWRWTPSEVHLHLFFMGFFYFFYIVNFTSTTKELSSLPEVVEAMKIHF